MIHAGVILLHFFASDRNFLDPQTSDDGTPYTTKRFKTLVQECWFVSSNLNTSYTDVLDISFAERIELINLIHEKQKKTQEALDKIKEENSFNK